MQTLVKSWRKTTDPPVFIWYFKNFREVFNVPNIVIPSYLDSTDIPPEYVLKYHLQWQKNKYIFHTYVLQPCLLVPNTLQAPTILISFMPPLLVSNSCFFALLSLASCLLSFPRLLPTSKCKWFTAEGIFSHTSFPRVCVHVVSMHTLPSRFSSGLLIRGRERERKEIYTDEGRRNENE